MAALLPGVTGASRRLVAGAILLAVVGLAVALVVITRAAPPDTDSPEAGFARDMATHHAQAVEMAFIIRDKTSDDALRALSYDIIATQSTQRGVFMGWLQAWGLGQTSAGARMAWMPGHAHMPPGSGGGALMHGMATDEELQRLRDGQGVAVEVLFLQLMIRHHEGGVIMARALEPLSRRADVVGMAKSMADTQRAEIVEMTRLLEQRGEHPLPSLLE